MQKSSHLNKHVQEGVGSTQAAMETLPIGRMRMVNLVIPQERD